MGIKDTLLKVRPLKAKEKELLEKVRKLLGSDGKRVTALVKQYKAELTEADADMTLLDTGKVVQLKTKTLDAKNEVDELNKKMRRKVELRLFKIFAPEAYEKIAALIAPNIIGFDTVKEGVMLQLFSADAIHLLLLGDPGTGKTDIIRSAANFAPVSSFGLGSGTSGAGLVVTVKGGEVIEGLLPKANGGICAIDELNLMKEESRAGLYNAMEKGFVTYDKGGHHYQFPARICVLATANPKGDKFVGHSVYELRKQLPFDSALLTRFHLVFLVRKPDLKKFLDITRKIVRQEKRRVTEQDEKFVQDYIAFAKDMKVNLPKAFEEDIVQFAQELKADEPRYLVEISPRLIVGITRLVRAAARVSLRDTATKEDLELVKTIVKKSLEIK